jgi:hypothetical protein
MRDQLRPHYARVLLMIVSTRIYIPEGMMERGDRCSPWHSQGSVTIDGYYYSKSLHYSVV